MHPIKKIIPVLLLHLFCCPALSFSQSGKADSLRKIISNTKSDVDKIIALNELALEMRLSNADSALIYAEHALELATKANLQKYMASSYNTVGLIKRNQNQNEEAIEYYSKALKIHEAAGDKGKMAASCTYIGIVHFNKGDYPKALEFYFKGLKLREEIKDTAGIASNYLNIGNIYYTQGDIAKALEYYLKSLAIYEKLQIRDDLMSDLLSNIGNIYYSRKDYNKTLDYYFKSLKIDEEIGNKNGAAGTYSNIGVIYTEQKKYEEALANELKGLKMFEELGDKSGTAATLLGIADIYFQQGKFAQVEEALKRSQILSTDSDDKENLKETYKKLALLYDTTKQYKLAYHFHTLYSNIKDTLLNQDKSKEIGHLEAKAEYDKHQAIAQAEHDAETKRHKLITAVVSVGLFLVLLFALFIYRSYRQKQKVNTRLAEQNILIEDQKKIVEEQHKDITDSIKYAQRIQQAILPPNKMWFDLLPNSFVLYKPKDILSGDFYWIEQNDDHIYFAAADCTGHGVPGALMSIVNFNLLNKAILEQEIDQPARILDMVNKSLTVSLHQTYNESTVRDGMDVALCAIQKNKTSAGNESVQLQFAGAFNGGYIYKKDGSVLDLNGDKMPVGAFMEEKIGSFTNTTLTIEAGDKIYIFSDGYADQFGGPKGKKLKYAKLKQYISESLAMDMDQQKNYLDTRFKEWKGHYEQVDDVLVIGVCV